MGLASAVRGRRGALILAGATAVVALNGLSATFSVAGATGVTSSTLVRRTPLAPGAGTLAAGSQGPSASHLFGVATMAIGFALAARAHAGALGGRNRALRTARKAGDYWEGEWICADCGYIYNDRAFGSKFEDLQAGFKCPQCSAPRRRFARKLGDKIGTTLDGGDGPILIFSAGALVLVLVIAYFALQ
mmetsp:Transcript_2550/g.5786  ORF Transcript_2550/g.5786 Transcript_2550/m.5786 type:complete len:189 (+) Transcript_2550:74-640(+)